VTEQRLAASVALACACAAMACGLASAADTADSVHLRMPAVLARPNGPVKPPSPADSSGGGTGAGVRVMRGVLDLGKHARFAGTWRLNKAKSKFGNIPGGTPVARTDVITQADPRIVQTLYMINGTRRDTTVYRYLTTGEPTVNPVDGRDIKSVVTWEGATLHLVSNTKMLVFDMQLDERWRLSPDNRTLTMSRHVKYPMGEGDQILVFDRR
jgi:hypothetical protein